MCFCVVLFSRKDRRGETSSRLLKIITSEKGLVSTAVLGVQILLPWLQILYRQFQWVGTPANPHQIAIVCNQLKKITVAGLLKIPKGYYTYAKQRVNY